MCARKRHSTSASCCLWSKLSLIELYATHKHTQRHKTGKLKHQVTRRKRRKRIHRTDWCPLFFRLHFLAVCLFPFPSRWPEGSLLLLRPFLPSEEESKTEIWTDTGRQLGSDLTRCKIRHITAHSNELHSFERKLNFGGEIVSRREKHLPANHCFNWPKRKFASEKSLAEKLGSCRENFVPKGRGGKKRRAKELRDCLSWPETRRK